MHFVASTNYEKATAILKPIELKKRKQNNKISLSLKTKNNTKK